MRLLAQTESADHSAVVGGPQPRSGALAAIVARDLGADRGQRGLAEDMVDGMIELGVRVEDVLEAAALAGAVVLHPKAGQGLEREVVAGLLGLVMALDARVEVADE